MAVGAGGVAEASTIVVTAFCATNWRLSQKGDFCEGILKSVHFSGIFFWEGVTLLSYDVRILVLGSVCLVFFVWADSRPVKKYCPCFSALYLGRRFGF